VPCGIEDKAVSSMQHELGRKLDINEVKAVLKAKLAEQFGYTYAHE
jgi:lipoyl(octanoyl) transferase